MNSFDNRKSEVSLGREELNMRFGYHRVTLEGEEATMPKHNKLRASVRDFASLLDDLIPEGRAKRVMFTELENASMWGHKAIAEKAPVIVNEEDK